MKKRKAALYNPYLDTLGGGERHILSILKVLDDNDFELMIFWDEDMKEAIEKRFDLNFKNLTFQKNIFKSATQAEKLKILSQFDVFFYVTDGSYFVSTAKKNFVFIMVPDKKLVNLNLPNKLKLLNWHFLVNSQFTQKFLHRWGVKSDVLYPYLDSHFLNSSTEVKKEKVILTVGRFFTHLHAKKHDELIKIFKKNKSKFPGYKLVLAGGLQKEDQNYFNKLKKLAKGDSSIEFKTNLSYEELLDLYKKSLVYWHFAGFNIDEERQPELVEHFGITPLEAMASGCMTFVYNAGGPKELIRDGETGYLFKTEEELINKTLKVIEDKKLQTETAVAAKKYLDENFSYEVFKKRVEEVIL